MAIFDHVKNILFFLRLIWRGWYYLMVLVGIILVLPLIIIAVQRVEWYPFFFKCARFWARFILLMMGFRLKVDYRYHPKSDEQFIFCANHTSEMDIMTALSVLPNHFVFIGKKELGKIPLFGYFYKRSSILVDRQSMRSRKFVYEKARERLTDKSTGIFIFPEGGVPDEKYLLAPFKGGAFRLSNELQIPIIPLTFVNHKERFPYSLNYGGPGTLHVVVHPPVQPIEKSNDESNRLEREIYRIIREELEDQGKTGL
jgi:1-acyl-sn-glycerol-3-phosphate acyltransferase